jgi:hydroxymethylpyrimidine pyrophosphatase-like HAD family hydrolase
MTNGDDPTVDDPTVDDRMVVALDVDGTLFDGETVDPRAIDAVRSAVEDGHVVVIVTGRPWVDLATVIPDVLRLCTLAVCEHGALVVDVTTSTATHLAPPVSESIRQALANATSSPMVVGEATIGLPVEDLEIAESICDVPDSGCYVVVNKDSIAIVPLGCDKGTGLAAAVSQMGLDRRRVMAIGDATNDLPMFARADVAIAVANAEPALTATGIEVTGGAFGAGVAEALERHLRIEAS